MSIHGRDLDRWITGNYGEDQLRCGDCGRHHDEPDPSGDCLDCGHDHTQRAVEGDEVTAFTPGHSDHCDCVAARLAPACAPEPDYDAIREAREDARREREEQL